MKKLNLLLLFKACYLKKHCFALLFVLTASFVHANGFFTRPFDGNVSNEVVPVSEVLLSPTSLSLSSNITQVSEDPVFFWDMERYIATVYAPGTDSTPCYDKENGVEIEIPEYDDYNMNTDLQAFEGDSSMRVYGAWGSCVFDNESHDDAWAPTDRGSIEIFLQYQGDWPEDAMIFQITGKSTNQIPEYDTNEGFSLRFQEEGVFRAGRGWNDPSGGYHKVAVRNTNNPINAVPGQWYHIIAKYEVGRGIEIVVNGQVIAHLDDPLGETQCQAWHQILIGNDTYTQNFTYFIDNFAVYDHWLGDVITNEPETYQLSETVLPADADDKSVYWSTSDPSVATVDANGLVAAVGPGTATITVTTNDGGYIADCAVSVDGAGPVAVTGVTVAPSSLSLNVNQSSQLVESVLPSNADNKSVTWSSDNTAIATVDANGIVTAVAAGNTNISVTTNVGWYSAVCNVSVSSGGTINLGLNKSVTVTDAANSATGGDKLVDGDIADASKWVAVGMPQSAIVDLGDDCILSSIRLYTYQSRAYQYIVEVSDDGVQYTQIVDRSTNTDGDQPITDAVNETARYVRLTVSGASGYVGSYVSINELEIFGTLAPDIIPVTGITLDPTTLALEVGLSSTVAETVLPAAATDKSVVWSTSDALIATVDGAGVVTAVSAGTATISATTNHGGFSAFCAVNVTNPSTPVNLALNKPTTVTDTYNSATGGDKLVDGDATDNSKWVGVGMPQTAEVDLGEICNLTEMHLYTYQSRAYQYIIEVSNDGVNYTTVVDRSANTDSNQPITDAVSCPAQFVRLTVSGASGYTGSYVSINELEVYGTTSSKGRPIIKTNTLSDKNIEVFAYPNPIENGLLNIIINGPQEQADIKLLIYDITGKPMYKSTDFKGFKNSGSLNLTLNEKLNTGIYILQVKHNNVSKQLKLIVK